MTLAYSGLRAVKSMKKSVAELLSISTIPQQKDRWQLIFCTSGATYQAQFEQAHLCPSWPLQAKFCAALLKGVPYLPTTLTTVSCQLD